jgi:signal transduction histidine kinase
LPPDLSGPAGARFPRSDDAVMDSDRLEVFVDIVRRVRHDANNPITAALGHVQLLLEDPAVDNAEVRESLRIVESELRRLIEIMRRLNEIRLESF